MMTDKDGNVLVRTGFTRQPLQTPPPDLLKDISETEPYIAVLPESNYVAAVIRLRGFDDMYLFVARALDPHIVEQLKQTELSVAEYAQVESRRLGIQVALALMFAVIALTILMASVLLGLNFRQTGSVAPIRQLMERGEHGLDRQPQRPGAGAQIGR